MGRNGGPEIATLMNLRDGDGRSHPPRSYSPLLFFFGCCVITYNGIHLRFFFFPSNFSRFPHGLSCEKRCIGDESDK